MSEHFSEGAARLAGIVARLLGWTPEAFWKATPAELAAILAPEAGERAMPLGRDDLNRLLERERNG